MYDSDQRGRNFQILLPPQAECRVGGRPGCTDI